MNNSLVSIIIPAYNAELYIRYSLELCLKQTYKNIEVIVINDGSTDNTQNIVDEYISNHSNIKLISIKNAGVSNARNMGIKHSSGEYLMFLDADDQLCSWAVEDLLNVIATHSADIVVGGTTAIKSLSDDICRGASSQIIIWEGLEPLKNAIEDHPFANAVWAKIYRKKKIENIFFDTRCRIHEDSLFFFMCCTREPKVVITDEVIHKCYISPNSASRSKFSEKKLDILLAAEEKKKIIEKEYPQFRHEIYNLMIKAKMAVLLQLLSTKGYRCLEKECISYIIKNKKYFIPAIKLDKKWFFIITHHLYYVYKWYKLKKR